MNLSAAFFKASSHWLPKLAGQQMQMSESTNTAEKCDKYLSNILAQPNYEIGGARQAAVAAQPIHVWGVRQLKSGFPYPDHSNKSTFSWVQAILKAQEASKVKNSCFKGIVHPTHFR